GSPVHGGRAQRGVGHGHHVHLDSGRLALPRGHPGSLLAQGGGMGGGREPGTPSGPRCPCDGAEQPAASARSVAPLRPRRAVRQRRLPEGIEEGRAHLQREPQGRLLGQCRRRKLLRHAQSRAGLPYRVPHPRRGQGIAVRVHRGLLQPPAPPFRHRLRQPLAVRNRCLQTKDGSIINPSTKPGQFHNALGIDTRCSSVGLHILPRLPEHILPPRLVVEAVEFPPFVRLCRQIQPPLKLADTFCSVGSRHRQSEPRSYFESVDESRTPSLDEGFSTSHGLTTAVELRHGRGCVVRARAGNTSPSDFWPGTGAFSTIRLIGVGRRGDSCDRSTRSPGFRSMDLRDTPSLKPRRGHRRALAHCFPRRSSLPQQTRGSAPAYSYYEADMWVHFRYSLSLCRHLLWSMSRHLAPVVTHRSCLRAAPPNEQLGRRDFHPLIHGLFRHTISKTDDDHVAVRLLPPPSF